MVNNEAGYVLYFVSEAKIQDFEFICSTEDMKLSGRNEHFAIVPKAI